MENTENKEALEDLTGITCPKCGKNEIRLLTFKDKAISVILHGPRTDIDIMHKKYKCLKCRKVF